MIVGVLTEDETLFRNIHGLRLIIDRSENGFTHFFNPNYGVMNSVMDRFMHTFDEDDEDLDDGAYIDADPVDDEVRESYRRYKEQYTNIAPVTPMPDGVYLRPTVARGTTRFELTMPPPPAWAEMYPTPRLMKENKPKKKESKFAKFIKENYKDRPPVKEEKKLKKEKNPWQWNADEMM